TPNLEAYGVLQATLDDDGGRYADNDALTLGARYRFGALSTLGLEATQGDRGHAVTANAEYQLTPEHSLYGRFTGVGEGRDGDSVFNPRQQGGWTLGQRWRLGERSNLFNESQYLKDPQAGSGLAHTFGMDFYPGLGWNAGFTLQEGELDGLRGTVHRRAVSVHGGR